MDRMTTNKGLFGSLFAGEVQEADAKDHCENSLTGKKEHEDACQEQDYSEEIP